MRQSQVAPIPPPSRWDGHGAMRNPRLSAEERSGLAAVHEALTTSRMPACLDALPKAGTVTSPKATSPPDSVPRAQRLSCVNTNGGAGDGVEQRRPLISSTVEPSYSSHPTPPPSFSAARVAGEGASLASPGVPTAMPSPQRNRLAYIHGLSRESVLVETGTGACRAAGHRYSRTHSDGSAAGRAVGVDGGVDVSVDVIVAKQLPPHLQPVAAATPFTPAEHIVFTSAAETAMRVSTPSTAQKSACLKSSMNSATVTSGGSVKLVDQILMVGSMEGSDSPSPSHVESSSPGREGDLVHEVAEACHGFLHHLPEQWARSIIRAVTLQTATLQVPQHLLRASIIFDAYAELRGEVAATLEAASAGKATASIPDRSRQSYSVSAMPLQPCSSSVVGNQSLSLLRGVNLQRLLTVAPALLRYRFRSARTVKAGELRAGLRANAQTATRTEASISRYAYLPHVHRDVHFGAKLAQGVMRVMSPGPRLLGCCPSHSCDDGVLPDVGPHHHHLATLTATSNAQRDRRSTSLQSPPASVNNTSLAAPVPALTYSTVSLERLPSVFLKDRYDVAHSDSASTRFSDAAQGGAGSSSNVRHSNHRRRHTRPFFEREFVATLASGQEDAALFTTTMAPEFMVGLPSFLKHPERAVPLSIAASLHHLYTAVSVEMFLRAYTAMTVKHATEASSSGKGAGPVAAKATGGQQMTTSPLLPLSITSPVGEWGDGAPSSFLNAPEASSSAIAALLPLGPALELGMVYVRNTIICSASTPGMESYLIFLHQIVYPKPHGGDSSSSTSGRQGAASTPPAPPPPPCRAVLQLSEEAKGSMAPPAMPASATASGHTPTSGTFDLPTIKHAAVELTQLVAWVQDERSHDPRHGQPFLCDLTFVSTYISAVAAPTPTSLCQPLPVMEPEDANLFPCAVVLATLDMWKALPPPEVSNLLRICFILDRHAQRVMELESPDYATEEMLMSAAAGQASITESSKSGGSVPVWAATSAIPFPDPRLKKHIATAVAAEVRTYLQGLPISDRGTVSQHAHQQQQRLLAFFMARLHYYEALNERHCKTEEALQREVLQRMARQRASPTVPSPQPTRPSVSPSEPSTPPPHTCDVYKAKTKSICDALAAVLAVEAAISSCYTSRGRAEAAAAQGVLWMHTASQQSYSPVAETPGTSSGGDDAAAAAAGATASIVVLLVPQRDVQRC
ncbi:hypothetical protein GH5_07220 [Leishmania sp. Ghana 2012 LV757]|uniref:hypothetical protein n=1 Tax=Leishmania sp. Ghana 2012 LV757 TaxID=2803181 RepID=UPI001B5DFA17|nr:hypothetical protein GH5_07220 [Leishmania sp. Ghana 2012 LV757]